MSIVSVKLCTIFMGYFNMYQAPIYSHLLYNPRAPGIVKSYKLANNRKTTTRADDCATYNNIIQYNVQRLVCESNYTFFFHTRHNNILKFLFKTYESERVFRHDYVQKKKKKPANESERVRTQPVVVFRKH